jgi:hypothetical protein
VTRTHVASLPTYPVKGCHRLDHDAAAHLADDHG